MNGKPLIESNSSALIMRAYNLGLKLTPNLPYAISLDDLEYWEGNIRDLKYAAEHGLSSRLPLLRRIFESECITVGPTDGTRTISGAKEVFSRIGAEFSKWGFNMQVAPTQAMVCTVHELIRDGTFVEVFDGLGRSREDLCFTQAQIIDFCIEHRAKLGQDSVATFFLLRHPCVSRPLEESFFVVNVNGRSAGRLDAYVRHFSFEYIWRAERWYRFVLPQLVPLAT